MASQTISGSRWPDGTTVNVYPAAAWPEPARAPSGPVTATASVAGGAITFTGLSEKVAYVAYAQGVGVRFLVPEVIASAGLSAEVDERLTDLEAFEIGEQAEDAEGREVLLSITIDGDLTAGQESLRLPFRVPGYIRSIWLIVGEGDEPTGSALLVDFRLTGNSIYASQEDPSVPFIADGEFASPAFGPRTGNFAAGDYLTAVVLQEGATTPGANLRAVIHAFVTGDEVIVAPTTPEAPPGPTTAYQLLIRDTVGVQSYWRLNETTGTTINDDIGPYNATIFDTYTLGATGLLATEPDAGISTISPGMCIQVPSFPLPTGTQSFSIEGWFKPSTVDTQFRRVLTHYTGSSGSGYYVFLRSGTGFYFGRQVGGIGVNIFAPLPSVGDVLHFVGTYDGTSLRFYVNGALINTAADANVIPVVSAALNIGDEAPGVAGVPSFGTFDEIAFYNVALSQATVTDHYQVGSGITIPPPPPPETPDLARVRRSRFGKVALYAALDETSGTAVTAQKHRKLFFKNNGWVNGRLADDAPLDPDPNNYAGQLYQEAISPGTYFNIGTFSQPIYIAPYDVSHIKVTDSDGYVNQDNSNFKWGSGSLFPFNAGWRSADAEISQSTYKDRAMAVWDPNTDKSWETFGTVHSDVNPMHNWPNVIATHGGKIDGASTSEGIFPAPLGSKATGLAIPAGLIRLEELELGEIPHALAFACTSQAPGFVSPATRRDASQASGANKFPEGGACRLLPDFDVATFADSFRVCFLSELMLYAVQRYGMFCADASGSVTFYGEDHRDPVTGIADNSGWTRFFVSRAPLAGGNNMTGVAATDVITQVNHGYNTGTRVVLYNLVGGAGLSSQSVPISQIPADNTTGYYYAIKIDNNTFKLSNDAVTPINFTTDITAGQGKIVHEGWRVTRTANWPWSSLKLLPPYDPAATHRTANTFNDLAGTHSGAVTVNQPSLTTGGSGKSALYAGGKTTFADDPMFDVGAACTIRAITKTTTVAAGEAIIAHRDVYELKRSGSSLIGSVTIGTVVKSVTATSVFAANTMADVALTYDGTNVKLWKNGVQAGSSTAATGSVDASSDAITVGSLADGTKAFSGQLQHVEVLQEALSVGRLLADYAAITT